MTTPSWTLHLDQGAHRHIMRMEGDALYVDDSATPWRDVIDIAWTPSEIRVRRRGGPALRLGWQLRPEVVDALVARLQACREGRPAPMSPGRIESQLDHVALRLGRDDLVVDALGVTPPGGARIPWTAGPLAFHTGPGLPLVLRIGDTVLADGPGPALEWLWRELLRHVPRLPSGTRDDGALAALDTLRRR